MAIRTFDLGKLPPHTSNWRAVRRCWFSTPIDNNKALLAADMAPQRLLMVATKADYSTSDFQSTNRSFRALHSLGD
jgi:hypothetical protein